MYFTFAYFFKECQPLFFNFGFLLQVFDSVEELVKRHRYEPLKLTTGGGGGGGGGGIDAGKTILANYPV